MLGDVTIQTTIEDDQYSKDLTPGAVSKLIDGGVDIVSGIIGTPNNLAVRQTLNDACIPQLNALTGSPHWGEVKDFPWTTGILVPYDTESKVYAAQLKEMYPNGAKVALFYVDSEFGTAYAEAFKSLAKDYKLDIVDEETIGAEDQTPPAAQVTNIASKKPDVVMAVPLGAGCVTFLSQLATAKAQNAGWTPATFITNTCASSLILGAAGAAADGLYTSGNTIDVGNPANANLPKVKEYLDYMNSIGKSAIATTAAAGWGTAEVTVAILQQAQKSADGLTRASIINAARNFTYTPMLARDGVVLKMNGEKDPFLSESLQVLQYKAGPPGTFTDVGKLITAFEH
jgi:branched-chain amino acid transport system substrate-binding protein